MIEWACGNFGVECSTSEGGGEDGLDALVCGVAFVAWVCGVDIVGVEEDGVVSEPVFGAHLDGVVGALVCDDALDKAVHVERDDDPPSYSEPSLGDSIEGESVFVVRDRDDQTDFGVGAFLLFQKDR